MSEGRAECAQLFALPPPTNRRYQIPHGKRHRRHRDSRADDAGGRYSGAALQRDVLSDAQVEDRFHLLRVSGDVLCAFVLKS